MLGSVHKMLLCCLFALGLAFQGSGAQQPPPPATDRSAQKILRAANALIDDKDWALATKALQSLLDRAEDSHVEVIRPGSDGKRIIVSTRSEAERVIRGLPAAGFQYYEKEYEPVAAQLLKEAKAFKGDDLLAEAARRFRYTKSGLEATELLANSWFDAGKVKEALPYFERLLGWPGAEKLSPLTLYQAALAVRGAGDKPRSEELWKLFTTRVGKEGLRVGDRMLTLQELRDRLEKTAPVRGKDSQTPNKQ